ncbi:hypothetical protein M2281_003299 [Mesorhizobium soli]|uniref:hypothetical protein n=1 Tax=Pseudaminobacter soli (ex Li et al. 2025) TaxID=1295366 RepID=UPI002474C2C7|nr:hypothetical protein [Mesorhizobium soli]MDH6232700.1 hypothetical protein [Mesorhizobium soli]
MAKRTKSPDKSGAALWTPWGLQGHTERTAQKIAIRKLLKRLAALDKRKPVRLAKD